MTVATITPTCNSPDSNGGQEPTVVSGATLRDHGAAGSPYSSPSWGDRHGGYFHGSPGAVVRDGQRRRGKGKNRVVVVRSGCFTWTRGDGERALRDPRDNGDGDGDGGSENRKREGEKEERNEVSSSKADSAEGLASPVEWTLSDLNFTIYSVRFNVDEKGCKLQLSSVALHRIYRGPSQNHCACVISFRVSWWVWLVKLVPARAPYWLPSPLR